MGAQRHRVTEQRPGFHPGAGDSGQLDLAHPDRALPVHLQPAVEVAGGERQFGPGDQPEGVRAERHHARHDLVHPGQLVRRVREPPLADRAEHQQGAQLQLVVAGADPPHHRQGGQGMLDRRRAVTDVHGQLGQQAVRHGARPRAVLVADQGQHALGGLDRADRIAGVLALVTEPLAGRGRRLPVGVGGERRQPLIEPRGAAPVGGVGCEPVRKAAQAGRSYASSTRTRPEMYTLPPGSGPSWRSSSISGPLASPPPIIIELFKVIAAAARAASARSGGGRQPRTASATARATATSRR